MPGLDDGGFGRGALDWDGGFGVEVSSNNPANAEGNSEIPGGGSSSSGSSSRPSPP